MSEPTPPPNAARLASTAVSQRILAAVRGRVPRADVDDVVQATYLRALLVEELPPEQGALLRFLSTIAHGLVVDFHRGAFRRMRHVADGENPDGVAVEPEAYSGADPVELRERADWVAREVGRGRVPPELVRWAGELASGLTCEEIARREGKTVSALKVAMHRARKVLHQRWHAYVTAAAVAVAFAWIWHAARHPKTEGIAADPDFVPADSASPLTWTLARARAVRQAGLQACENQRWADCLQDFDEAKTRDPAGDAAPEVTKARAAARAAMETAPHDIK